jgi:hypothetical protein
MEKKEKACSGYSSLKINKLIFVTRPDSVAAHVNCVTLKM